MIVKSILALLLWGSHQLQGLLPTFLVFFFGLLVASLLLSQWQKTRSLPPGPWSIPFVGHRELSNHRRPVHVVLGDLCRTYGSIISVRAGKNLLVAISKPKVIREAFRREEFTGRPNDNISQILGNYGIINVEGTLWKDQRRFLHERLRSFGMKMMGVGKLEDLIMKEVEILQQGLLREKGRPLNLTSMMTTSVSNVITSVVMSTRFNFGDPRFARYMHLVDEGFALAGSLCSALHDIPVINLFLNVDEKVQKLKTNRDEIGEFFKTILDEHRRDFDRSNIRDIVDGYLLEIEKAKEEDRDRLLFDGREPDRQMEQIMADLFTAGMETVKTTLMWAIIFILHNPDIQKNVQEELDAVVGPKRSPRLTDMSLLPYTEATICEVLRHSSIVPLGTTHATTRDVDLDGFTIPKGSHVIPLLREVHHSPSLWEQPEKFNPNRFLDANGRVFKPDYFMPFGVGRRMCLGEVLARMEIFLFITNLLHSFHLRVPEGCPLPSLQGQVGVTVTPAPFQVCLVPRRDSFIPGMEPVIRSAGQH